jgi:hypothetical protein
LTITVTGTYVGNMITCTLMAINADGSQRTAAGLAPPQASDVTIPASGSLTVNMSPVSGSYQSGLYLFTATGVQEGSSSYLLTCH